jgi:CRP/FNR family transcriptional regulator, cyclic AMP receptor protein
VVSTAGLKTDDKLYRFFLRGEKLTYRKGQMVMPGDNKHVFMVEKGFVRAYNVNDRGDSFTYIIYTSHDVFPAFRVFDEDPHVHYEALGEAVVYALPRATLAQAARTDIQISNNLLRLASRQAHIFNDRVRNLEYRLAPERVIFRLILMTGRFGEAQPDGSHLISAPISQPLLASTVNASRESVSRTMEILKNEGLISYNSKHIIIHDLPALKARLDTIAEQ